MKEKKPKKISKKLTNKPSMDEITGKPYVFEEYTNFLDFKKHPVSEQFIEHFGQKLLHWATRSDDAYKLSQFLILEGVSTTTFERWSERVPVLKECQAAALTAIGNRREIGGLTNKLNASLVASTMPHYDKTWKKLVEWKEKLKQKEEAKNETRIVIMERSPNSDLVPVKVSKDPEDVANEIRKSTVRGVVR